MHVAVESPDVLCVLPRVLDEARRMSIAVAAVRATTGAGHLIVEIDPDATQPALVDRLLARISQMMEVASVTVGGRTPETAPRRELVSADL